MGGKWAKVKSLVGLGVVVLVIIGFCALALCNPDMTRTRLLLTFWPQYLAGLAIIAVGLLVAGEAI